MKPRNRKKQLKRRSVAEWERIVAEYNKAIKEGMSTDIASQMVEAPFSSIYRWMERLTDCKIKDDEDKFYRTIQHSIVVLTDINQYDHCAQLEAIFTLIIWYRWPKLQNNFDLAMMTCVASYLSQAYKTSYVTELSDPYSNLACKYLNLDVLSKLCSADPPELPHFGIYNYYEHPYSETDLASDIVWFAIAYASSREGSKNFASLGKAHFASQNGIFRFNSRNAPSSFRKIWRKSGAPRAFFYIEKYHQGVELFVDPSSKSFSEEVDELLNDPVRLRLHFAKCRGAVELLQVRLDRRALTEIRFPEFPSDLEAASITPPPLPIKTQAIFEGYTKLQTSFKDNEVEDD